MSQKPQKTLMRFEALLDVKNIGHIRDRAKSYGMMPSEYLDHVLDLDRKIFSDAIAMAIPPAQAVMICGEMIQRT